MLPFQIACQKHYLPVSLRVALELVAVPFTFTATHSYTPASPSWVIVNSREALYSLWLTLREYWTGWPFFSHVMLGNGAPSTTQVSENSLSVRISASSGSVIILGESESIKLIHNPFVFLSLPFHSRSLSLLTISQLYHHALSSVSELLYTLRLTF